MGEVGTGLPETDPVRRGRERDGAQLGVGGDHLARDLGEAHAALAREAALEIGDVGDQGAGGQRRAQGLEVAAVVGDGRVLRRVVRAHGQRDGRGGVGERLRRDGGELVGEDVRGGRPGHAQVHHPHADAVAGLDRGGQAPGPGPLGVHRAHALREGVAERDEQGLAGTASTASPVGRVVGLHRRGEPQPPRLDGGESDEADDAEQQEGTGARHGGHASRTILGHRAPSSPRPRTRPGGAARGRVLGP